MKKVTVKVNTGNVGPHEIPNVWILGIDKREDFRSMEQNLQKYDKRKKIPKLIKDLTSTNMESPQNTE